RLVLRQPGRRCDGRPQRPGRRGARGATGRAGTVSRLTPAFEGRRSGTLRTFLSPLNAISPGEPATVCRTPATRPCQGISRPACLLVGAPAAGVGPRWPCRVWGGTVEVYKQVSAVRAHGRCPPPCQHSCRPDPHSTQAPPEGALARVGLI